MIAIDKVSKTYTGTRGEKIPALELTSLDIPAGSFTSIIGPSGCGKSTLLRMVGGLESPSTGTIRIAAAPDARRTIGFVFQDAVLLPWLTALENIRFPLDTAGMNRTEAEQRAHHLLGMVGLAGFERALPRELSGGMRQRASIARALSYNPPVLLMDEPFGALDLLTRDRLNDELLRIWEETGKTVLFVTHSVEEAAYLSDRVLVMSPRPGRVKRSYDVELPRPRGDATKLDPVFHRLMADFRQDLR